MTRALPQVEAVPVGTVFGQLPGFGDPSVTPLLLRCRADKRPEEALDEVIGPLVVLVEYDFLKEVVNALTRLEGSLSTTVHLVEDETAEMAPLIDLCASQSRRVIFGGWPTGVAVAPAMQHGGLWPSPTNALHTSVGLPAARRFLRPVCYQDAPDALLPPELRDANPLGITRCIDGVVGRGAVPPRSGR